MITRRKYIEINANRKLSQELRKFEMPVELKVIEFRLPIVCAFIYFEFWYWRSAWDRDNYERLRAAERACT